MIIINKSGNTIKYEVLSSSTMLFQGNLDNSKQQYFDLENHRFDHVVVVNVRNSPQIGGLYGMRLANITQANKDAILTLSNYNPESE